MEIADVVLQQSVLSPQHHVVELAVPSQGVMLIVSFDPEPGA